MREISSSARVIHNTDTTQTNVVEKSLLRVRLRLFSYQIMTSVPSLCTSRHTTLSLLQWNLIEGTFKVARFEDGVRLLAPSG